MDEAPAQTESIRYLENAVIPLRDLITLYDDAGWVLYTRQPEVLAAAIANSLYHISAWQGSDLVGLIRAVGDGVTIVFIQDILVRQDFQRRGIGTRLLKTLLAKYEQVRQIELLTDDTPETRAFYEANGFIESSTVKCLCYLKLRAP